MGIDAIALEDSNFAPLSKDPGSMSEPHGPPAAALRLIE